MDVLVVGAGPGGATVASELASAGLRVTVLEKSQLPRFKPCSGGLPVKIRPFVPLSDEDFEDNIEDLIHTVRFTYRHRDPVVIKSEDPLVYMVRRDRFDHALISEAARRGARILDGVEVVGVDPVGERVRVRTTRGEFAARVVIGADGVYSAVARSVGLAGREKMGFALQARVPVSPDTLERWRGQVGGDFGRLPHGIGWVFPKSDHLSVGLLSFNKRRSWKRDQLYDFLRGHDLDCDLSRIHVYGHDLPRWYGQRDFQMHNVLLLGDAAGIANPLTGAGVEVSMRSARIAAEVVRDAFWHGDKQLENYSERVLREICREFLDVRAMARLFFTFTRFSYQMGVKNPEFGRVAARLLTGDLEYSDVWGQIARTFVKNRR
jgi:geranylgeranyl reductase family protein